MVKSASISSIFQPLLLIHNILMTGISHAAVLHSPPLRKPAAGNLALPDGNE